MGDFRSQPIPEPVRRCKHDVAQDCPACAEETIVSLKADLAQCTEANHHYRNAVDVLESNARVQAKLLADTGRWVEEQDKLLAEAADYLNSHSRMDGMDIGAKITAYRFEQQKAAKP